jgi:hypothetical protein
MSFAVVTMLNVGICMGTFNLIINAFFLNIILKWVLMMSSQSSGIADRGTHIQGTWLPS